MQFDIRDAAAALNVQESTVYRWIQERKLPATGFAGQYRFGRSDLLEWATQHNVPVAPEALAKNLARSDCSSLRQCLSRGGIFHDVAGETKPEVLKAIVERLPLPDGCDREMILQLFLAREAVGSSAVGGGVAIPHPRHPVVLCVDRPLLSLCFLRTSVPFGATDGRPVHALFVLLSPTVQNHLDVLARVACLLRDEPFARLLAEHPAAERVLAEVDRVERGFETYADIATRQH